jgi:integrase
VVKSKRKPRSIQSAKPTDCPLTLRSDGRYCRKVRGHVWYFGKDPEQALKRWEAEKDDIIKGRDPRTPKVEGYTLGKLCNDFLIAKQNAVGKTITPAHFHNLHQACARVVAEFGHRQLVGDIGPDDFEKLGFSFPPTWGLRRKKREIGNIRALFLYAAEKEKITRTRFGTFKQPRIRELDDERLDNERQHGGRQFTPEQLRAVIAAAPVPIKAMALLGVNCGYGNTDIAKLTKSSLDLVSGWGTFPRVKTSVARRAQLWPETIAAVNDAIAQRPFPNDPNNDNLVFVTENGLPWVRAEARKDDAGNIIGASSGDSVQKSFRRLLSDLGIKRPGLSFYSLRHCTETHGGSDQVAIDRVMGHKTPGMGTNYRRVESISDDRLRAVAASIHAWLFSASDAK